jgi:hypothetical protein
MLVGQGMVAICSDCVQQCVEIIADERSRATASVGEREYQSWIAA